MAVNLYQQQKLGNEIVALVRRIFNAPEYAKAFKMISANQIRDADGKDVAIKVEMHVPGNPKASHTTHIPIIGFTAENKTMWPFKIKQAAKDAVKRMRMTGSRAKEVAAAEAAIGAD